MRLKDYYQLTKPGIIYGNIFTTIAGFLFAAPWKGGHFGLPIVLVFVATVAGLSLVIGSACVFNNYLDRAIDRKMERTSKRALASGAISVRSALTYGSVLGIIGFGLLCIFVNPLSAGLALFAFIFYVVIYGYVKRISSWGAVVGSVPGAMPIVVGYTAATNQLDLASLTLFLVLVAWQMPHFYAIAMYRLDEYKAAGIPVLPATKGMRVTKIHTVAYIVAFILAMSLLFVFGYAGYIYLVLIIAFGLAWLWRGLKGFRTKDDIAWARNLFLFSLIVLVLFCISISIAPWLP